LLAGLHDKELSIEYNTAPPDGSSVVDGIGAWFSVRIKRKTCSDASASRPIYNAFVAYG